MTDELSEAERRAMTRQFLDRIRLEEAPDDPLAWTFWVAVTVFALSLAAWGFIIWLTGTGA